VRGYDRLENVSEALPFNHYVCDNDREWSKYQVFWVDHAESKYQTYDFLGFEDSNDKCLYINEYINVCSLLRPHYHEILVHYPASFLQEPKRVLIIGGGDNMVLHEVLKYPSLELVVNLELDQTVVRNSFKHFGTQPHWDNDKVQWWFGDAAKSILVIPGNLGPFDLVLVDLQSDIIEALHVTEDLDIMDAALLLLAPDGVIARDVEYAFDESHRFTKFAVDLYYADVPIWCHQGITVGSNAVDFLFETPIDHGLDNLYFDPAKQAKNKFNMWYNYRRNNTSGGFCDGASAQTRDASKATASGAGVIRMLETEDVMLPLDSPSAVGATISQALKKAGLTVASMQSLDDTHVLILKEGYVVARTWPDLNYCAFDVSLWSDFHKLDVAETELVSSMRSSPSKKSTSSYSVVTSGMFGANSETGEGRLLCRDKTDLPDDAARIIRDGAVKESVTDAVLTKSLALVQDTKGIVVVLCGEQKRSCSILDAIAKNLTQVEKIMPLWTCPGLAANVARADDVSPEMSVCNFDILLSLLDLRERGNKIVAIAVAPEAHLALGQILHKIMSSPKFRGPLMADNYVVVAAASALDLSEVAWRRALLDRFRTDFEQYDPAYRTEILFNDTDSSVEMDVFSSGDGLFYSHLVDTVNVIEQEVGLKSEIRLVKNARNPYAAGFEPSSVASPDDYDERDFVEQWKSQRALGRQSIFQFNSNDSQLAKSQIEEAFRHTLQSIGDETLRKADIQVYDVGRGCVAVSIWPGGSIVLLWNGMTRIDVNLFTLVDNEKMHDDLEIVFMERVSSIDILSRDNQPRGLGRVVLFEDEREVGETFGLGEQDSVYDEAPDDNDGSDDIEEHDEL